MARKTTSIQGLKDKANDLLRLKGPEFTQEFRRGVIAMIEPTLFSTGNYAGFSYHYSEWDVKNQQLKADYDDTRRRYY